MASRHTLAVMAGRVPAIFAPADEARVAGTRPVMKDKPQPIYDAVEYRRAGF